MSWSPVREDWKTMLSDSGDQEGLKSGTVGERYLVDAARIAED